ncbi:MAG: GNAT family N-acetyltransferase [Lutibacter sp.]|uniref:GNAT family N-acetyltransferase n=1 Tax=Lutibacter sp. TaxID=1925666 RepID=UPI0019FC4648|nr:GNAT family N-acetyltransferase [Lutibacter sp.]NOR29130.1 GNAT family N-acetyltransferase [Lutibacter sp.]
MILIKKIKTEDTYPIRLKILRKNIPLPYKFNGDFDKDTFHLGAFENGKLIAVSSYMKALNANLKGTNYQLRGMATLTAHQGSGVGKLMMQEAFNIFQSLKINYIWCNARLIAVNFYKKQGFEIIGENFDVKYIGDHYMMFKKLSSE